MSPSIKFFDRKSTSSICLPRLRAVGSQRLQSLLLVYIKAKIVAAFKSIFDDLLSSMKDSPMLHDSLTYPAKKAIFLMSWVGKNIYKGNT